MKQIDNTRQIVNSVTETIVGSNDELTISEVVKTEVNIKYFEYKIQDTFNRYRITITGPCSERLIKDMVNKEFFKQFVDYISGWIGW